MHFRTNTQKPNQTKPTNQDNKLADVSVWRIMGRDITLASWKGQKGAPSGDWLLRGTHCPAMMISFVGFSCPGLCLHFIGRCDLVDCDDLNKNGPHGLIGLKVWSPGSDSVSKS